MLKIMNIFRHKNIQYSVVVIILVDTSHNSLVISINWKRLNQFQ